MALLQVKSISKRFFHRPALRNLFGQERAGSTLALDSVSFDAAYGDVIAILGPNGSGKTTLFKIIAGMLSADTGIIQFNREHDEDSDNTVSMAVASERSFFPRLTARENLDYFAALENIVKRDRPADIKRVLEIVDLAPQADVLVQKFSSGMYQRLAIARALLRRPKLLLLDEPTRSLDPAAAEMLWEWIRNDAAQHATVLIATHNFSEAAAVAREALILSSGRMIASKPTRSPEELRAFYFSAIQSSSALTGTTSAGKQ
jgi:ABC-2 type transport system ATP-binding protein